MMPKSTGTRSPFDEDVAGMHVGVEEAVAEHLLEEHLGGLGQDHVGLEARRDQGLALVRGDAAHPLERQDPARGALPVHPRHAKAFVLGAVLGELRSGCCLEPQVHLHPRRGGDGLHHRDRPEPAAGRLQPLDPGGDPGEEVEVARHQALDVRPQHLDRDRLALAGHGEVHLRDRRRGHGAVVEAREQVLDRTAQLELDHAARHGRIEGLQRILQL
jgi:hypothetical protein